MKKSVRWFALLALLAVSGNLVSASTWVPVWSDEFNGTTIDGSNWTYDTGGGGWETTNLSITQIVHKAATSTTMAPATVFSSLKLDRSNSRTGTTLQHG